MDKTAIEKLKEHLKEEDHPVKLSYLNDREKLLAQAIVELAEKLGEK